MLGKFHNYQIPVGEIKKWISIKVSWVMTHMHFKKEILNYSHGFGKSQRRDISEWNPSLWTCFSIRNITCGKSAYFLSIIIGKMWQMDTCIFASSMKQFLLFQPTYETWDTRNLTHSVYNRFQLSTARPQRSAAAPRGSSWSSARDSPTSGPSPRKWSSPGRPSTLDT